MAHAAALNGRLFSARDPSVGMLAFAALAVILVLGWAAIMYGHRLHGHRRR